MKDIQKSRLVNLDEAITELANAVIIQAVDDWRHTYRDSDKYDIEKFFLSPWFDTLARNSVKGKAVLEFLREEESLRQSKRGY